MTGYDGEAGSSVADVVQPDAGSVSVHRSVEPVETSTVPVGVPLYWGVTVGENVTVSSLP